jgi:hypothetical protein
LETHDLQQPVPLYIFSHFVKKLSRPTYGTSCIATPQFDLDMKESRNESFGYNA